MKKWPKTGTPIYDTFFFYCREDVERLLRDGQAVVIGDVP